jgi:hypothetical protein
MTKAKAIRELAKLGWTVIDSRKGKSSVEFNPPICSDYPADYKAWASGKRHLVANPQDLLAELRERGTKP